MKYNIFFIAIIIFAVSCGNGDTEEQQSPSAVDETVLTLTQEQFKSTEAELGALQIHDMKGDLPVNGLVELAPENVYSISVPMGGFVKTNSAIAGKKVQRGTLLATIEDMEYIQLQQDYLTAKARAEYLFTDYNRQKELSATESNSKKVYQQSKADYETQNILLKSLAEKLKLIGIDPSKLNENNISRSIAITSPSAGYISKVNVNIGKYVNPSDVMFELVNPSNAYLKLDVFEGSAAGLEKGQLVVFNTIAQPGKERVAAVDFITMNLDEDRTVEVRCNIKSDDADLLPGTFVNARISMNARKTNVLPNDAIVDWQGKKFVFVQESANNYRLTEINVGEQSDGFTEITSIVNKPVITKNAYTLLGMLKNKAED